MSRHGDTSVWRRLVLLATPLALAVLEIFHPQPDSVAEGVEQGGWFLWFHMIQLLLTGLIALAVYLLTDGLAGRAVSVSRWATAVFAVFFSACDAAAGIATGFVLQGAQELSPEEQTAVYETAIDMPGPSLIFVLAIVGTAAWVVAVIAAALALRRAGVARGPCILADPGRGVPAGRASLPLGNTRLRMLLRRHRLARVRTGSACQPALERELNGRFRRRTNPGGMRTEDEARTEWLPESIRPPHARVRGGSDGDGRVEPVA